MDSGVEEIKNKIEIVSFIGSLIGLKKSGRNYKGLCPFHQEKTPSFVVSPDRQIWHCFGACQIGGDVISFWMKWENITFIEALRDLAQKAGVKLKKVDFEDKLWKKKERLLGVNLLAAEFFEYILSKTKFGEKGREYLKSRDVDAKIQKTFQIGYAPASWDSLLKFLKRKKYAEQEILDAGLVISGERGGWYDRFRGRLIFPLKDARNNVIGFSGRVLDQNAKEAKYVNTPETLLYHKRETLYGINVAKESIKKEGNAFLVEGEFDVISPYKLGIENVVAIKGSAVTKEQLILLKRYTEKITLALDSDTAGEEAMKRGIEEAESLEMDVSVIDFDFAKDPDEAARKDPVLFKKVIKNPLPFYDFIINYSLKKNPDLDAFAKKKIADEVATFIEKIKNPIVYSHYVKKLASLLDVSENSIELLVRRMRVRKRQQASYFIKKQVTQEILRENLIQKYLLSIIFQSEKPYEVTNKIFKIIRADDFFLPVYQKICNYFFKHKELSDKFNLEEFTKSLPAEVRTVFDELYLFASLDFGLKNETIEKLAYELKRYSLKKKISDMLSLEGETKESKEKIKEVNKELSQVEKMI